MGACLLALLAVPARAVDRPVPSANFPTISSAVAAAQSGDRILVAPGIYQEHVVSAVPNLQFIGRDAVWDGTLVNGSAGVCLTATGDGTLVQGFIFRAGQSNVAQVQLTGDGCRVLKCLARGPNSRFLRIEGNSALVDSCSLLAVNSTAIEIIGDGAVVRKVKARQCDDVVVGVQGNGATVTRCTMSLNEDSASVSIGGNDAIVSLNTFLNCDIAISITGANATVANNKAAHLGFFLLLTGTNAFVQNNRVLSCTGTFLNVDGNNAFVRNNRASTVGGTFLSVFSDNAVVENNHGVAAGTIFVTGDGITIRGNTISDAPNDKTGLTATSRTAAGGGLIENNWVKDMAQSGLVLNCHHTVVRGNHVIGAGIEFGESGCVVGGSGNEMTNNVVTGGGTHGFDITGPNNTLVQCLAFDSAADGFHIAADGNTLLGCVAMNCTGEGLDNGAADTTVMACIFKSNRLDVANDGTFSNAATFTVDNVFTTGGPNQSPQVD